MKIKRQYLKARHLFFQNKYIPRKFMGYGYSYDHRFLFVCPCGSIVSSNHGPCRSFFSDSSRNRIKNKICTTMSYIKNITLLPVYKYFGLKYQISNNAFNIINLLGSEYFHLYPLLNKILIFQSKINKCFKLPNKQLYQQLLVINDLSTNNIDRSHIDFKNSRQLLESLIGMANPYYLKLLDKKLNKKIEDSYSKHNQYRKYVVHEYEKPFWMG